MEVEPGYGPLARRPPTGLFGPLVRWAKRICLLLGLLGLLLAIFLTLRADASLTTTGFFPPVIATWLDAAGRFRNFPAYAILTLCMLLGRDGSNRRRLIVLTIAAFATALECMQIVVPSRWFDLADILWSWAGVAAAWVLHEGLRRGLRGLSPARPHPRRA